MVTKYHFLFFLFIIFFYFQDLENSASSDAIVREKIARLPPDVSEVVHLEKLKSAKEGAELMEKVTIFYIFYYSVCILETEFKGSVLLKRLI